MVSLKETKENNMNEKLNKSYAEIIECRHKIALLHIKAASHNCPLTVSSDNSSNVKAYVAYVLHHKQRSSIKEVMTILVGYTYTKMRKMFFTLEKNGYIQRLPEKVQLNTKGNCRSWQWEAVKLPTW